MSDLKEILKEINTAWESKDEATLRKNIHPAYSFEGPMMKINGVDECVESAKSCPFEGSSENFKMIQEGNTVVQTFDWVLTAPFKAKIPMIEVAEFEDNKVKTSRMYFDTALFPAEFTQQMKEQAA